MGDDFHPCSDVQQLQHLLFHDLQRVVNSAVIVPCNTSVIEDLGPALEDTSRLVRYCLERGIAWASEELRRVVAVYHAVTPSLEKQWKIERSGHVSPGAVTNYSITSSDAVDNASLTSAFGPRDAHPELLGHDGADPPLQLVLTPDDVATAHSPSELHRRMKGSEAPFLVHHIVVECFDTDTQRLQYGSLVVCCCDKQFFASGGLFRLPIGQMIQTRGYICRRLSNDTGSVSSPKPHGTCQIDTAAVPPQYSVRQEELDRLRRLAQERRHELVRLERDIGDGQALRDAQTLCAAAETRQVDILASLASEEERLVSARRSCDDNEQQRIDLLEHRMALIREAQLAYDTECRTLAGRLQKKREAVYASLSTEVAALGFVTAVCAMCVGAAIKQKHKRATSLVRAAGREKRSRKPKPAVTYAKASELRTHRSVDANLAVPEVVVRRRTSSTNHRLVELQAQHRQLEEQLIDWDIEIRQVARECRKMVAMSNRRHRDQQSTPVPDDDDRPAWKPPGTPNTPRTGRSTTPKMRKRRGRRWATRASTPPLASPARPPPGMTDLTTSIVRDARFERTETPPPVANGFATNHGERGQGEASIASVSSMTSSDSD